MNCRNACGACCIAISISSAIPGMPHGKPAGVPCIHLMSDARCAIFGRPERPAVCSSFPAMRDVCGDTRDEAFTLISIMEVRTSGSR